MSRQMARQARDSASPASSGANEGKPLPLDGLRIIDAATILAAPFAATLLSDFGAEVIKVERPGPGDALRSMGSSKSGVSLWWKIYSRNKRAVTLDLQAPEGQGILKALLKEADVFVENFRPGTLEKWGLGWDELHRLNPRLTVLRISGYGRAGPYAGKPGFGTLCEAMSGFAALNGDPDGPPTVPPLAVGDCIAGLYGAIGILVALLARARGVSEGQCIDVSLLDAVFSIVGYQAIEFDQLGKVLKRTGNRSASSIPRNVYRTSDDRWLAVAGSTNAIAQRALRMIGGDELARDPRYASLEARQQHANEVDAIFAGWVRERTLDEALAAFEASDGAAAPAYEADQIMSDPQFQAAQTIVEIDDEELGRVRIPNVVPRLSETPGRIRFTGRRMSQDTSDVLKQQARLTDDDIARLRRAKVV